MSVNKVILVGRLGQDPEIRYTPSGSAVCNFSLATSESWKDKNSGQKQEKTEWHRVIVWNKAAELCKQYLGKGRQVYIEGRLQTRAWDDKTGNKRYTTEILAQTIQFLDSKGAGAPAGVADMPEDFAQSGASMGGQGYASSNSNSNSNTGLGTGAMNIHADDHFTADDIPF